MRWKVVIFGGLVFLMVVVAMWWARKQRRRLPRRRMAECGSPTYVGQPFQAADRLESPSYNVVITRKPTARLALPQMEETLIHVIANEAQRRVAISPR